MPGRKYSAGSEYRYGFNGQEKSKEVFENSTTAEFWQYDSRIGRRWNLDPKPIVGLSNYSSFGGNPIAHSDRLGDVFKIGGKKEESKKDVKSLVNKQNESFIKFKGNKVELDFKGLSQKEIDERLKSDEGLDLVNKLVNSKMQYLYEATDEAYFRSDAGQPLGIITRNPQGSRSSIQNLSDNGFDSNGQLTYLPRKGYNGQVIIDTKTTWDEVNADGTDYISKRRNTMVFHELAENYFRTEFGEQYHPGIKLIEFDEAFNITNIVFSMGAHNLSIAKEKKWNQKSGKPGEIGRRNAQSISTDDNNKFFSGNGIYIATGLPPEEFYFHMNLIFK